MPINKTLLNKTHAFGPRIHDLIRLFYLVSNEVDLEQLYYIVKFTTGYSSFKKVHRVTRAFIVRSLMDRYHLVAVDCNDCTGPNLDRVKILCVEFYDATSGKLYIVNKKAAMEYFDPYAPKDKVVTEITVEKTQLPGPMDDDVEMKPVQREVEKLDDLPDSALFDFLNKMGGRADDELDDLDPDETANRRAEDMVFEPTPTEQITGIKTNVEQPGPTPAVEVKTLTENKAVVVVPKTNPSPIIPYWFGHEHWLVCNKKLWEVSSADEARALVEVISGLNHCRTSYLTHVFSSKRWMLSNINKNDFLKEFKEEELLPMPILDATLDEAAKIIPVNDPVAILGIQYQMLNAIHAALLDNAESTEHKIDSSLHVYDADYKKTFSVVEFPGPYFPEEVDLLNPITCKQTHKFFKLDGVEIYDDGLMMESQIRTRTILNIAKFSYGEEDTCSYKVLGYRQYNKFGLIESEGGDLTVNTKALRDLDFQMKTLKKSFRLLQNMTPEQEEEFDRILRAQFKNFLDKTNIHVYIAESGAWYIRFPFLPVNHTLTYLPLEGQSQEFARVTLLGMAARAYSGIIV